ncbi:MAG: TolB family protein, partial [Candidatus Rokuibacteriota bacterium]
DGFDAENPTATADGQWVVYNSTNPSGSGIWKIRPDGTGATRLVPGTWSTPDVSPDGSHVVFRTGTVPRAVWVARTTDGQVVGSPIELPGDNRNGRPRWAPDGRSLMFTGSDETGAFGIYAQEFPPGPETASTRRRVAGFVLDSPLETFGISPDGKRLVYSTVDQMDSLMLADGLRGVEPRQRPTR